MRSIHRAQVQKGEEMITRRSFVQKISGAALMLWAGTLSVLTTGCSAITDIIHWIPVALVALNSIQNLLGPILSPVINSTLTPIKTAFSDLLAAAQAYNSDTNPADKATNLAKIQTFLNNITTSFQNLITSIPGGAIASLVLGLVQIILSTIAGFVNELPTTPAPAVTMSRMLSINGQSIPIIAVKNPTNRGFKKSWNAAVESGGHPEMKMSLSFGEHF
jgi:hypothetical protein